MLTDQFRHSLDSKNRIIIPAKHREQLGPVFMITKGVDSCLNVYSMEEWNYCLGYLYPLHEKFAIETKEEAEAFLRSLRPGR